MRPASGRSGVGHDARGGRCRSDPREKRHSDQPRPLTPWLALYTASEGPGEAPHRYVLAGGAPSISPPTLGGYGTGWMAEEGEAGAEVMVRVLLRLPGVHATAAGRHD